MRIAPACLVYVSRALGTEGESCPVATRGQLRAAARRLVARDGWAPVLRGTREQLVALGAVDAVGGWYVDTDGRRLPCEATTRKYKSGPSGPTQPEAARTAKVCALRLAPPDLARLDALATTWGVGRGVAVVELLGAGEALLELAERYDVPLASVAEIAIQLATPRLERALLAALGLPEALEEYQRVVGAPPPPGVLARARASRESVEALRSKSDK